MDKVYEVFLSIKENPSGYLPEKSIWTLQSFLKAYSMRVSMEGLDSEMNLVFRDFELWLCEHFEIRRRSQSVYMIVESYSAGSEDALNNFYGLFEQFQATTGNSNIKPTAGSVNTLDAEPSQPSLLQVPRMDLFELLRTIRRMPELYLGYAYLSGLQAYLAGHERARIDLGLPRAADEELFGDFKQWIEKERFPGGRPRPWFKLIKFHCNSDCGHTPHGAYSVFFRLLDDFAKKIGQPNLFEVAK